MNVSTRPASRRGRAFRVLGVAAALAPPVMLAVVVARYAQNVPYQDQWVFARLVVKDASGGVSLGDVWGRHIDHRVLRAENSRR